MTEMGLESFAEEARVRRVIGTYHLDARVWRVRQLRPKHFLAIPGGSQGIE